MATQAGLVPDSEHLRTPSCKVIPLSFPPPPSNSDRYGKYAQKQPRGLQDGPYLRRPGPDSSWSQRRRQRRTPNGRVGAKSIPENRYPIWCLLCPNRWLAMSYP
ncbi:hypothetical protein L596_025487 [Steinernema carpocapsae]|uniref:Uncharacterized protein n=1 Tax=Steinernema carpocapsae TaxID=34508 RepID=A0A4U5M8Q9_STECR|nr:hypothetical protein L596_025487 [Steinernema carpocapsae]